MIRTYHAAVGLMACALFALPCHAACTYPPQPGAMPDGRTATLEQMKQAQKTVKQYAADMDMYLKCIDDETPKPSDITADMSDARKREITKQMQVDIERHNAAVNDEQTVAGRFNDQLKIFKAKQANN
jgi:hypothetical protein